MKGLIYRKLSGCYPEDSGDQLELESTAILNAYH